MRATGKPFNIDKKQVYEAYKADQIPTAIDRENRLSTPSVSRASDAGNTIGF